MMINDICQFGNPSGPSHFQVLSFPKFYISLIPFINKLACNLTNEINMHGFAKKKEKYKQSDNDRIVGLWNLKVGFVGIKTQLDFKLQNKPNTRSLYLLR